MGNPVCYVHILLPRVANFCWQQCLGYWCINGVLWIGGVPCINGAQLQFVPPRQSTLAHHYMMTSVRSLPCITSSLFDYMLLYHQRLTHDACKPALLMQHW